MIFPRPSPYGRHARLSASRKMTCGTDGGLRKRGSYTPFKVIASRIDSTARLAQR